MNRTLITILLLVLSFGLFAQWSTNALDPTQIYGLTSAQVLPKTAITDEGITWIAWMDNSTGNYNTYLQKLDIYGTPEWTEPLLVSSHTTMTWLTEWDIDCDVDGNAILCFQDIRLGTNNVVIYKISSDGNFLWGNDGIMLSNDTDANFSNMSPTVLCLPDGRTIAAWQRMETVTSTIIQSIASNGDLEWGTNGITLVPADGSDTWPQLLASGPSNVLLKYYEDTGPFWAPTRHILVQKYNSLGQGVWTAPVVVQGLGGIEAWQQLISIKSDNAGGMVIAWHDDRNATTIRYTYVQHVMEDGTVTMPVDGAAVSTETGTNQFYPKIAFEPVSQETYVFWNRVNGNQDMWGLQMQKLSADGTRLWGETGMAFITIGNFPTYPIAAMNMQSGVVFLYDMSPVEYNDQLSNIKAYCVNPDGDSMWDGGLGNIAVTTTPKLHYDTASDEDMWGVVTWEDGSGPSNVYAMRFNYNGSLGMINPVPYDLQAELVQDNDVLLTWQYPDGLIIATNYRIYRNDVMIYETMDADTLEYLVTDLGPGVWSFYVTAVYESGDESLPSNEVSINITGSQDENITPLKLTVSAYPNPFSSTANFTVKGINAADKATISVYNVKGQIVRQVSLTGKQEQTWCWDGRDTNSKQTSPGMYFIKVNSGHASASAKLMKF